MWPVIAVGVGLYLVCGAVYVVVTTMRQDDAKDAYRKALDELGKAPADLGLRQKVLELGRVYSSRTKNSKGEREFDEAALMNDMNAACLRSPTGPGGAGRVESAPSPAPGGQSLGAGSEGLAALLAAGVLTSAEFDRGKELLRRASPERAATVVRLLRDLKDLRDHGVIAESEFSTKKQDILAERLISRK